METNKNAADKPGSLQPEPKEIDEKELDDVVGGLKPPAMTSCTDRECC